MKKLKIYLDTSAISHLDAPDRPDRMTDTLILWDMIKLGTFDVMLSSVDFFSLENAQMKNKTL